MACLHFKIKLVLLLGAVLGPRKLCRPRAVSRKSQILSATFLISRPRETPQYCKETHMFSVSSKPLSLDDSPFFFWKICCELPLISRNYQARAPIEDSRKTESNTGAFRTHFGTWIYSRFFLKKRNIFKPQKFLWSWFYPRFDAIFCSVEGSTSGESGT